jgi:hypothetical protein
MACGNDSTSATNSSESPLHSITAVTLHGDAEPTVRIQRYTDAEWLLVQAARESASEAHLPTTTTLGEKVGTTEQAISIDSLCSNSDLRLFDQTNFIGNEICFNGPGRASLANYCRYWFSGCKGSWANEVHSFKAGDCSSIPPFGESGQLQYLWLGQYQADYTFGCGTQYNTTDQVATYVYLQN